ncbi:murein L,D-transpeptidase [Microbulbifer sp. TYP-18]|uniref:murein L,D-transpeptidase n=1 Tax=Microbulbifer sp. TYP-18 TaxID=3230024 RepID=UPI0034C65A25
MGNDHRYLHAPPHYCGALVLALYLALDSTPCTADGTDQSRTATAPEMLSQPLQGGSGDTMDPFTPVDRQYTLMREELARYTALTQGDVWQPLDGGQTLAPGMRHPRVRRLRSLLMQYGDLTLRDHTDTNLADLYDPRLQRAVRRFQRRHGLQEDALVDERTRRLLNVNPQQRVRTLAANLSRWDMMPRDLGPRYIVVNIPDFSLRLIHNEREQLRMRVVVGKPVHATPQLTTRLTRLVFNPIWRVPPSIAVRELLPKGAARLTASGYRLVNHKGRSVPFTAHNIAATRRGKVTLQQKGGPGNALGRVKFVIPNPEAIFLHDTNSKHLFKQSQRAFSHGCIRLEKPLQFARLMLTEQNSWSPERAEHYINSNRTRAVELKKPLPVYIAYWSAWVDEEGLLQFRPDIYGRDQTDPTDASADNGSQSDQRG